MLCGHPILVLITALLPGLVIVTATPFPDHRHPCRLHAVPHHQNPPRTTIHHLTSLRYRYRETEGEAIDFNFFFATNLVVRNFPTTCLRFWAVCTPMSFTKHREPSFPGAFPHPSTHAGGLSWLNPLAGDQSDGLKIDSCPRGNRSCHRNLVSPPSRPPASVGRRPRGSSKQ
jgi:hypothetical protein